MHSASCVYIVSFIDTFESGTEKAYALWRNAKQQRIPTIAVDFRSHKCSHSISPILWRYLYLCRNARVQEQHDLEVSISLLGTILDSQSRILSLGNLITDRSALLHSRCAVSRSA
jgi:hypothetical protein